MITYDKAGGRTIHLFIPFDFNGKKIETITLAPLRLGHSLRWSKGDWKSSIEFLVELAGVEEAIIRELRYPDADRVMETFMAMMTPEIRADLMAGTIPEKFSAGFVAPDDETPRATNGSGEDLGEVPHGPGDPLPEEGFDLGEEP